MKNRLRIAQGLVIIANIALIYLGYGHWRNGLPNVSKVVADAKASPFFAVGMKILWVLVSWHWIAFGLIALPAAFGRKAPNRGVLSLCGLAVLVDAIATFAGLGLFRANEALGVAAVALFGAAALYPSPEA